MNDERYRVFDKEYCSAGETLTLSPDKHEQLKNYIIQNIQKRKNINKDISSYGLKHHLERKLGFYVSNSDCKKAMIECGFKTNKNGINWNFNISAKSLKPIWKV